MSLSEAIKTLADKGESVYSVIGKVKSVDASKMICSVTDLIHDVDYTEVRLGAEFSSNNGFIAIPKIGSFVVVTFLDKNEGYIALVSEVDKYVIKSGNEDLKQILFDLLTAIEQLTVPTGVGPSGIPINIANFTTIKQRLNNLFL